MARLCKHAALGVIHRYKSGHCVACQAEYSREWGKRNPDKVRAYSLKASRKNDGIVNPEAFDSLLQEQGGVCAICKTSDFGTKGPCLDHCHETGLARGVLCTNCNLGIGHLRDSPELIRIALDYLLAPLRKAS